MYTLVNTFSLFFLQVGASNFDSRDLQRIHLDDSYIRRFLMHHDNDQRLALEMIMETLQWRKENNVNGDCCYLM